MLEQKWYVIGSRITWFIVFFGSWIYCISAYGYLLGLGLGWLPSYIVAFVVALAWPFLLGICAFAVILLSIFQ
jgi:hypothetical protein